jgi:hypothetical protein
MGGWTVYPKQRWELVVLYQTQTNDYVLSVFEQLEVRYNATQLKLYTFSLWPNFLKYILRILNRA